MASSSTLRATWIPVALGAAVEPVEWHDVDATVDLLRTEKIVGIVADAIERGTLPAPPEFAGAIDAERSFQLRRASVHRLEIRRIAREAGGLRPPVLLKGLTVSSRYPRPGMRLSADVDLLVPPGDAPAWGAALRSLGYGRLSGWDEQTNVEFNHDTMYAAAVGSVAILVEMHTKTFLDRRARRFDYDAVANYCDLGESGMLEPRLETLLVLLALHYCHHIADERALIWMRDFVELGTPDAIRAARAIAERHDVGWAIEEALHDVEKALGRTVWNARLPSRRDRGLARATASGFHGARYHMAVARQMRPVSAARYLGAVSKASLVRARRVDGVIGWAKKQLGQLFRPGSRT